MGGSESFLGLITVPKPYSLKKKVRMLKTAFRCHKKLGYWPDFIDPKTYNEKIHYRKFSGEHTLFAECSDKFAVRKYVEKKVGSQYLIPLIDHVKFPEELKFEDYGENFVVKANHDSGGVYLCKNGNFDAQKIRRKLNKKLKIDNGIKRDEPWYSDIKPSIIVEGLLLHKNGDLPADFKFHVFNRPDRPKVILQVDYGRFSNHSRTFYDEFGEVLPFSQRKKNHFTPLDKPSNLSEMVEVSKKLAEDFDYVRVDLYNVEGEIFFGELTFAHSSGFGRFIPDKYDRVLGDYWPLRKSE